MTGLVSSAFALGGNLIGGAKVKKASRKAQAAEVAAQQAAMAEANANTAKVTDLYAPQAAAGKIGLDKLSAGIDSGELTRGFTAADFAADPGYAFRQAEGEKAINRGAAARGNYYAPATIKSLSEFSGNLASEEYGSAYGRFKAQQNDAYSKLLGLTNIGLDATDDIAGEYDAGSTAVRAALLGQGEAQSNGLRERGAITAKQWTEGSKQAASLVEAAAAAGAGGGAGGKVSLASIFAG